MFTTQRDALSDVAYALLASVPLKPTDVPASDSTVTSSTVIRVTYSVGTVGVTAPDDGGSPLVSYEVQMDDGLGGDFVSLSGKDLNTLVTHLTVTQGIKKGRVHRFRYRAKNAVGWGDFSDEASILAANVPSAPVAPTYNSFSSNTLNVVIGTSADNGGTAI